jgi:hypothetical protein
MYGKLFASLYDGTLRGRANEILVFTNMIARADRYGNVDRHPRAIADDIGLPLDQVAAAIQTLESPDPESRSRDANGARIVRVSDERTWGWRIVNYLKYRAIRNEEDRQEQNREAVARHRANKAVSVMNVSRGKPRSSKVGHGKPLSSHGDGDGDGEGEGEGEGENIDAVCIPGTPSAPMPMTRSWMDWKITIGRHRVYIDREGNAEVHWAELYSRTGWDEFTKAWEYCAGKTAKPGGKVFLSNMLEVIA